MFGEEDYERELHELVAQLGLDGRVEFRGFREDVWPELARFDVLVHASVVPEPFGTVVLEGMAAGLAVMAPDEGGPASMICDGETGRLFRSRDAHSLARAMSELAATRASASGFPRGAGAHCQDYDPGRIARRLEEVYFVAAAPRRRRLKDRAGAADGARMGPTAAPRSSCTLALALAPAATPRPHAAAGCAARGERAALRASERALAPRRRQLRRGRCALELSVAAGQLVAGEPATLLGTLVVPRPETGGGRADGKLEQHPARGGLREVASSDQRSRGAFQFTTPEA